MIQATEHSDVISDEDIRWFHSIDLGDGRRTNGLGNTQGILDRIHLPKDLAGKSVLDIGAWDGFYSFEAEKRGAERVLATDHYCWSGDGWGTKAGFNYAHRQLNSQVESLDIDVMQLDPVEVGVFDVVLFLGVLYHLESPMDALHKVASVTGDMLILETASDLNSVRQPAIAFYQGDQLNADPTNWIGPNEAAIHAMLRAAGFSRIETVYRPGIRQRLKSYWRHWQGKPEDGRVAVHAWK